MCLKYIILNLEKLLKIIRLLKLSKNLLFKNKGRISSAKRFIIKKKTRNKKIANFDTNK